ncbi:MAG: SufS family cysteine desulfurase [Candidatus Aminicenantes bacterium]|nr:SufS family cysteine desulfurase [Candidatus Aminicenantes bacterium]NIM80222.1 SufS family cysteine desulfurase [Candidatus Aminicenantes bacterium]NIN19562.1 SufS family cysteine desulfurase [Candidatus Aminicenantes bacterium]NIN43456.1 SufS family cysteine desulfurase [Candidatus Aminicenantes bacterium]NIN86201.1 SufS family cysteine desulfurase [Candidatus Aminicenantes bacterium]
MRQLKNDIEIEKPLLNLEALKADFPVLQQVINDKPLVYFDNAATTQKPRVVIERMRTYYEMENSNVHRGVHTLSQRATDAYENARETVRAFINAAHSKEIIFVRGATEAINLVARSFGQKYIKKGDEILISAMEHHSNIVPWQMVCEEKGARLRVIPMNRKGELNMDAFTRLLGTNTRLVAVTHVSNALGTVNPVSEIIEMAHRKGIPVLVDGAQSVPHMPVDVRELGCDFFVFSGHKMYGPTGIGVLYGRAELLEEMPPYQGGGDMIRSVTFDKTTFNGLPYRFEAGTPNIAGAVGLAAAVEYLNSIGMDQVAAHEKALLDYATNRLLQLEGLTIFGNAKRKAGVISFLFNDVHPHDIGTILDQEGVAIRTGHHCAQPVMDFFSISATARASFGLYNTTQEIDRFIDALKKIKEVFG